MKSSDNLTDNEVAFAAINLFANKPVGPEPDWQDIQDWHMDLLDDDRADQVLSHVANNPDIFQMWRDICEADEFLAENPMTEETVNTTATTARSSENPAPWDLVGWLSKGTKAIFGQPLPAIGGAVAATVLAVIIVPKLMNDPTANPGDLVNSTLSQYAALGAPLPATALPARTTRSLAGVLGNLSTDEIEKYQINNGFRQAFDTIRNEKSTPETDTNLALWMPWRESLPEATVDCTLAADQAHCKNVSADMTMLGQWALVTHLACLNGVHTTDSRTTSTSDNAYAALANLNSIKDSSLLTPFVSQDIVESGDKCSLAGALISFASE